VLLEDIEGGNVNVSNHKDLNFWMLDWVESVAGKLK
jgi:hypothetical protein